jgi:hypothetical protein
MEPLKMSNSEEGAVGKQQQKIQSMKADDWALPKQGEEV